MTDEKRVCSYCGKPAGELTLCVNCGAELHKRITIKPLVLMVGILIVVGVVLTHRATFREISVVQLGDLTEAYDREYVWVQGTVFTTPVYDPPPRASLRFHITDGTGSIEVRAYSPNAEILARENKIPNVGDNVSLFGMVSARLGRIQIVVDNAVKFYLERMPR